VRELLTDNDCMSHLRALPQQHLRLSVEVSLP
jgi:hypothetical protein